LDLNADKIVPPEEVVRAEAAVVRALQRGEPMNAPRR
jgi:hypothetical protein